MKLMLVFLCALLIISFGRERKMTSHNPPLSEIPTQAEIPPIPLPTPIDEEMDEDEDTPAQSPVVEPFIINAIAARKVGSSLQDTAFANRNEKIFVRVKVLSWPLTSSFDYRIESPQGLPDAGCAPPIGLRIAALEYESCFTFAQSGPIEIDVWVRAGNGAITRKRVQLLILP